MKKAVNPYDRATLCKAAILVLLFALLLGLGTLVPGGLPAHAADATYIYTTFKGDSSEDQELWVYTSTDAVNFDVLSDTNYQGPSGALRDPSIIKHTDGNYYIVYTVQSWTTQSTHFNIATSSDLINWSHVTSVDAGVPGTAYTWAPEFFVDGSNVHVIVSLGTSDYIFVPYIYTARSSDLTSWSDPVDMGIGPNHIDTFVVQSDGSYHAFIKDENSKYIEHATATSLTGPWTWVGIDNWSGWGSGYEGPSLVQMEDGTWRIYVDKYTNGGIWTATSTDLNAWTGLSSVDCSGCRHGTVLRDTEYTPPPTPTPPPAPPAMLWAWYRFDDNAQDSSGNGWHGTLVNGPTFRQGQNQQAVNLDGTNDYVALPDGIVSDFSDFTIATWVRLDRVNDWTRIFDFGSGSSTGMFLTPRNGNTGVVRFAITTSGQSGEQRVDGTAALPARSWTHVAVTRSGTTATLYVDGVQVGQNSNMTLNPYNLGHTTNNWLGRSQYPADPYLDGQLDQFRIYSYPLTAEEVMALYQNP